MGLDLNDVNRILTYITFDVLCTPHESTFGGHSEQFGSGSCKAIKP